MLGPKNNDLKSISDFNSRWADRIALLILVGLGVDIGAAFVSNDIWHKGLTIVANSLIAIGVWGELRFAKRAREADDGRVAEANATAAIAQKKAADARERTAEIERLTAWRHISWEQSDQIIRAIRRWPLDEVLIEYPLIDIEAAMYAAEIKKIFKEVEAKDVRLDGYFDANEETLTFGLFISSTSDIHADTTLDAFNNAGVMARKNSPRAQRFLNQPKGPQTKMHIYVGHKPR